MSNDSNIKDHPHHVTVTAQYRADGTELTPNVKFECRTEAGTGCRVYPACECESWDDNHGDDHGDGHEPVPHEECWLQGWFDGPSHCYAGDDNDDMGDYGLPRGMNRSGPVDVTYGDDYVEWFFVEATR